MPVGEVVAIVSAVVAALALAFSVARERKGDVVSAQAIRDKLDYISDTARDTREDVRALDRKLDDHASRLSRVEARLDDHDRRLERVEGRQ